jgi:alpha-beta hydrolase superfamily lysophospholipase
MLISLLVALGCGLLAAVALVWWGSHHFTGPNRRPLESRHREVLDHPGKFGLQIVPTTFATEDGHTLTGLFVEKASSVPSGGAEKTRRMAARLAAAGVEPASQTQGTVILLHGRGGIKEDLLAVCERWVAADFRCVVYDARAHGQSDGGACTFGAREAGDLRRVIDATSTRLEANHQTMGPLVVWGMSLGAAVTIQALPEENRIAAAIAVAPFAELEEVVIRASRRMIAESLPESVVRLAMLWGGGRAGFDPFFIQPIDSASQAMTPLMLVHGSLDSVIPVEHSQRLYEASTARSKILRVVPNGTHGSVLLEGGDELYAEMILFALAAIKG